MVNLLDSFKDLWEKAWELVDKATVATLKAVRQDALANALTGLKDGVVKNEVLKNQSEYKVVLDGILHNAPALIGAKTMGSFMNMLVQSDLYRMLIALPRLSEFPIDAKEQMLVLVINALKTLCEEPPEHYKFSLSEGGNTILLVEEDGEFKPYGTLAKDLWTNTYGTLIAGLQEIVSEPLDEGSDAPVDVAKTAAAMVANPSGAPIVPMNAAPMAQAA